MNIINKTFQQGEFNFLMLKPAINSCQVGLGKIARDDLVLKKLQKCESKRYKTELGHFTEVDAAPMTALTKRYIQKLITSLDSRFLDHDILTLFGILDSKDIPDAVKKRTDYDDTQIEKLCTKFKLAETTTKLHFHSFIKFVYNFPSLKSCKTAGHLWVKVLLQERFAMHPEIIKLMKIVVTIILSTAGPERGFSTLKRVKSFMRNRLLNAMFNALMQISLNRMHVLSDEQANAIAEKWLGEKRRKVTPRGKKDVLGYGEKMENRKMKVQGGKAKDDKDDKDLDLRTLRRMMQTW